MLGKKRKELVQAAHRAWVLGGVQAMDSLKSEMTAQDAIYLPDSSEAGGRRLLSMMSANRGANLVESAWADITGALRRDGTRSPIEKRLMYRQTIISAGLLTGEMDRVTQCLELEEDSLRLSDG